MVRIDHFLQQAWIRNALSMYMHFKPEAQFVEMPALKHHA